MSKNPFGYTDDDWTEIIKRFDKDYDDLQSNNQTFHEMMWKHLEKNHINVETFVNETGLNRNVFSRIKTDKKYYPNIKTLVTICIGLDINIDVMFALRRSTGYDIKRTERAHCAYIHLMTAHRGKSIEECNEILKKLGITKKKELLGSAQYK